MSPRFFADVALQTGTHITLPDHAARHVQVLRLQPGEHITLFNGASAPAAEGEFDAVVTRMGRSDVDVTVGAFAATQRESPRHTHLAVSMPANDRMDWLIEKATELGVASIWPLMSERSVLRLKADRADKKVAHWRGIAVAACEQSGRNRLPTIHPVSTLADWLKSQAAAGAPLALRCLLSVQGGTQPLASVVTAATTDLTFLSGPEGGLSPQEEAACLACGWVPITLGARVLRAETAPLACLAYAALAPLAPLTPFLPAS